MSDSGSAPKSTSPQALQQKGLHVEPIWALPRACLSAKLLMPYRVPPVAGLIMPKEGSQLELVGQFSKACLKSL